MLKYVFELPPWVNDQLVMHLSICNINIPPPTPSPGHLNFSFFGGQIPIPQFQKAVQIPHM